MNPLLRNYDFTAARRVVCTRCQGSEKIAVNLPDQSITDLTRYLEAEIITESERRGWKAGYCPDCAHRFYDQLAAEHNAEDRDLEVES